MHFFQGRGAREAAKRINWRRVKQRLESNITEIEENPVESHPKTFVILQIGSVLQVVKICGFQGVVWAKVWAVLYIGSFIVCALPTFITPEG